QWQAVWKISEAYLTIMTIALSTYLMPKLSSLNESVAIKKEVNTLSLAIIPCTIVLAFLIYITRDISISLLFTNDFYNARELFL
ncbi:O-antigen flippase, partial [Escherichia coli]|nr:O-antigen flippase [Escherichia coli]